MRRDRRTWAGRAIVVGAIATAMWGLLANGGGVSMPTVARSWQLLDLRTLGSDPLGSVWYLHTQPPLHNLVVGGALWLPGPSAGTLFVLYVGCLLACGLLLHDLLVRWRVGPIAAGAVAGFTMVNPGLLDTIFHGSYEVPVATLIVGALWAAQRYLQPSAGQPAGVSGPDGAADSADSADPAPSGRWAGGGRWLVLASVLLTLACLTRSLLHPVWVAGALVLLLAARPVPASRRATVGALLVPVLLVGGWMAKNEVLFGTPTLSSWLGFNVQRGVVGPMEEDAVREAVRDGDVSPLATRWPWLQLDEYGSLAGDCTPRHDHRVAAAETKVVDEQASVIANFNNECYIPLYHQASDDALTLVRRYPGRYLQTRGAALRLSFMAGDTCRSTGCTWMDALYDPLRGDAHTELRIADWNLPLYGQTADAWEVEVALVLAAAAAFVVGRGAVGAVRLVRRPRREGWPADEVLWVLAAWTVVVVIVGGDLLELGENGRFRTMVDPLLLAFPLGALARQVAGVSPWRRPSWARRPG